MMKHLDIYTRTQGDSFSNVHCIVTYNLHVVTIFLSGIVAISFCVNSSDYRVFTLCVRGSDDYMNNLAQFMLLLHANHRTCVGVVITSTPQRNFHLQVCSQML